MLIKYVGPKKKGKTVVRGGVPYNFLPPDFICEVADPRVAGEILSEQVNVFEGGVYHKRDLFEAVGSIPAEVIKESKGMGIKRLWR